jgi:hypothetical protein
MTTSIRSIFIIAIAVAAAIVPAASAGASPSDPVLVGYSSTPPVDTYSGNTSVTAISHDPSAPPSDASSGSSSVTALSHDSTPVVTLHRDGSKAVPVVADLGPEPSTTSGDEFDWGDAAIGAGAVLLVTSLAMAAAVGFSGRRSRTSQPTAASQSA